MFVFASEIYIFSLKYGKYYALRYFNFRPSFKLYGVILDMWWATNSIDHSKVWTVNLFHTMELLDLWSIKFRPWHHCRYDILTTDIVLNKQLLCSRNYQILAKLPRDVSLHYMLLAFVEFDRLSIRDWLLYRT